MCSLFSFVSERQSSVAGRGIENSKYQDISQITQHRGRGIGIMIATGAKCAKNVRLQERLI